MRSWPWANSSATLPNLRQKPSATFTRDPDGFGFAVLVHWHISVVSFSMPCSRFCCFKRCLQGSWQFNEALRIKKGSALHSSAYFYKKNIFRWHFLEVADYLDWLIRLVTSAWAISTNHSVGFENCPPLACWGAPIIWGVLVIFWDCVVGNFCHGACACYSLSFPQAQAVNEHPAWKQEYHCLLGCLAKCWKSHHQQSAFQREHVRANCIRSDKLVKL